MGNGYNVQPQGIGLSGMQQNANPYFAGPMNFSGSSKGTVVGGGGIPQGAGVGNNNPFIGNSLSSGIGAAQGLMTGISGAIELGQELNAPREMYENMRFQTPDVMVDGVPSYAGVSSIGSKMRNIDADEATRGMELKGFSGGAKSGAAIGGAIGTGVGLAGSAGVFALPLGAIGAGVGALAGGLGGWIAGKTKKGKAAKAAYEAQQRGIKAFDKAQGDYNTGVEGYFDTIDANRSIQQGEREYTSRMYGVNRYNDPFSSIV